MMLDKDYSVDALDSDGLLYVCFRWNGRLISTVPLGTSDETTETVQIARRLVHLLNSRTSSQTATNYGAY